MNVGKSAINGGNQNNEFQSKAENQASEGTILQAYKRGTAQLQSLDEEPVQGKFGTVQLYSNTGIIQKVDEKEAPKLEAAYDVSDKGTNQQAYMGKLDELGYEFEKDEDDLADEQNHSDPEPVQLKSKVIQLARKPNTISGPKNYGGYTNLLYKTDGVGNIDFKKPFQHKIGNAYPGLDPVENGSEVDITDAGSSDTKNRYQHFKRANDLAKAAQKTHGDNGSSPDGFTWHHLTEKYKMHLVKREVHRKHGHNGGVYLW